MHYLGIAPQSIHSQSPFSCLLWTDWSSSVFSPFQPFSEHFGCCSQPFSSLPRLSSSHLGPSFLVSLTLFGYFSCLMALYGPVVVSFGPFRVIVPMALCSSLVLPILAVMWPPYGHFSSFLDVSTRLGPISAFPCLYSAVYQFWLKGVKYAHKKRWCAMRQTGL